MRLTSPYVRLAMAAAGLETVEIEHLLWDRREPGMLEYGTVDHGPFLEGIGDFTEKIRSGVVMPNRGVPSDTDVPAGLAAACRAFGYTPEAR